jgi:hypothetical protein
MWPGYGGFSNSCALWLTLFFVPRGLGHARYIHFLFDASEGRLIGFPQRLVFVAMHTARCHESMGITGQYGTGRAILIIFKPCCFEQSAFICEM